MKSVLFASPLLPQSQTSTPSQARKPARKSTKIPAGPILSSHINIHLHPRQEKDGSLSRIGSREFMVLSGLVWSGREKERSIYIHRRSGLIRLFCFDFSGRRMGSSISFRFVSNSAPCSPSLRTVQYSVSCGFPISFIHIYIPSVVPSFDRFTQAGCLSNYLAAHEEQHGV